MSKMMLEKFNETIYYFLEKMEDEDTLIVSMGDEGIREDIDWKEADRIVLDEQEKIFSMAGTFPIHNIEIYNNEKKVDDFHNCKVSLNGNIISLYGE